MRAAQKLSLVLTAKISSSGKSLCTNLKIRIMDQTPTALSGLLNPTVVQSIISNYLSKSKSKSIIWDYVQSCVSLRCLETLHLKEGKLSE